MPEVDDEYAYSVAASFKMGKQAVNADFSVEKDGRRLEAARGRGYDLDLQSTPDKTLPMLINGVQRRDADKVPVVPRHRTPSPPAQETSDYGKSNT